jgi:hypothetical protein
MPISFRKGATFNHMGFGLLGLAFPVVGLLTRQYRQTYLPTVTQVFLHAFGGCLGIAAAPTHNRSRQPMDRKRHFRSLYHCDDAIKHQCAVDYKRTFAGTTPWEVPPLE